MAEQQTRDQAGATESTDDTTQTSTDSQGAHAAPDEGAAGNGATGSGGSGSGGSGASGSGGTGTAEDQAAQEQSAQDQASRDQPGQDQPAQRSPSHPRPQKPSEEDRKAQEKQRENLSQGGTRTEEPPAEQQSVPRGRKTRKQIDLHEAAWKIANVLATLVRVVGYLFAVILVVFILLTLIGVNPLNGVAQFVGGFAQTVVGPFRDLFLIAEPTTSVIVNFGIAAVVWAILGEFLARVIRFVGARLG